MSKLAGEEIQSGWLGRQDAQLIEHDDGCESQQLHLEAAVHGPAVVHSMPPNVVLINL